MTIGIKHLSVKPGQDPGKAAAGITSYVRNERDLEKGSGYYTASGGAPGVWIGEGARALGLEGPVNDRVHNELLQGHLPNGEDISRRGGRQAERRMATDLTMSAPKSFSLLAIGSGDDRLKGLWDEAVGVAAGVIERECITARRGHGGSSVEHTGKMVASAFTHEDARTIDGRADPDLHTHLLVMNMTQRGDGEWVARDLDFGKDSVLRMTADYAAKAHLAKRLQELGYPVRITKDGFEVEGISQAQIDAFSRRRDQVDVALAEQGLTREGSTAAQRDAANLGTRGDKTQLSQEDQRWEWRERMREASLDLDRLERKARTRGPVQTPDLSSEAVKSAARHLGERESVFSKNQIRLEALRAGMGGATLETVEASMAAGQGGLLDVGGGRLTTRDALHREQEILARARAGHDQTASLLSGPDAMTFMQAREASQGFAFSNGQREALFHSLTSQDSVLGIVGAAGAGKTTSMAGYVQAARAGGYQVVGIAPSAVASHELKSAGADDTRTLASLLASKESTSSNRIYILDEAGMVSGPDMDALLKRVDSENARLLMVGDPRQLSAVEAGSPFQQMLEMGAIRHANIDEIQRQRDPKLREIAQAFARGEAAQGAALARLYMHDVHIQTEGDKPTTQEKRAAIATAIATDYLSRDRETRDRTLVVSGTNDLRRQTNERIREGLREQGAVSQESVTVTALDKAGLTREQQARAESYRPGMVVRLEEGHGRDRHPVEYRVQEVKGNSVTATNREGDTRDWNPAREKPAGVYQPRDMDLSPGDKIVFRENQHGVDRIRNGESATIDRLEDGKAVARLESGKEVTLDPSRGQTVDYGWCRTIHASQGATVDHVVVAGEASRVATAQTAYVAASRERDTLKVYTDNPTTLEKTWAKFAEREHALSTAKDRPVPNLESLKDLRAKAAADLGRHGDLSKARDARESQSSGPTGTGHSTSNARERSDFSLDR